MSPRAVVKVFTGETVPAHVVGVKGEISDDMRHFTLYWSAPQEGADGGYINPANLTYNVYLYDQNSTSGSSWVSLAKGLENCEYTFTPDTQDYYRIAIEAENVAGVSTMVADPPGSARHTLFLTATASPTPRLSIRPNPGESSPTAISLCGHSLI